MNAGRAWWMENGALERFVGDLLAAEFGRIRPGRALPTGPWPPHMPLDESGLGADSLDRLKLATALGEAIHLQRSGIDDTLLALPTVGDWVATAARSLATFDAELTFRTSGSTGEPKWCLHSLLDLTAEIAVIAERFAGCRRIIATVPSHHIYGFLFTLLLPAWLCADVLDVRASSPARLATLLQAGDLLVGHPDFLAAFVRAVPAVGAGIQAVTSSAPCPPAVARAVTACGIESLVEVYGSSETAGIGWRDDPAAAYALFPYWQRGAADDQLVRRLPNGSERLVRVPDRLRWDDARHVQPAGRADGALQIGGQNVFPERVRDVLRTHPRVADADVRRMRPDEGDRLKAFVVPRDPPTGDPQLRAELWDWLTDRLTAPERPTAIAFGPALPAGPLGKAADWPIDSADLV